MFRISFLALSICVLAVTVPNCSLIFRSKPIVINVVPVSDAENNPEFLSKLVPIQKHKKLCYIDTTGTIRISTKFKNILKHQNFLVSDSEFECPNIKQFMFHDGVAVILVRKLFSRHYHVLNPSGDTIFESKAIWMNSYSEGLAAIQSRALMSIMAMKTLFGYVDLEGAKTIESEFEYAGPFRDGIAKILTDDGYAFIDKSGSILFSKYYAEVRHFSEGMAAVRPLDKFGYIDQTGEMKVQPTFNQAWEFSEGIARVLNEKYQFITQQGTFLPDAEFDFAFDFSEGLACVRNNDKFGYISKSGDVEIEFQFDAAASFGNKRAPVKIGDKWGYIDLTGEVVIQPQFDIAYPFVNGLAIVLLNEKAAYINSSGSVVAYINPS